MDIKLDPDMMKELFQKSVLDQLTPEQKEKILADAVASLFVVPPKLYASSQPKSPLQEIFDMQVTHVARELVRAELETPESIARLRAVASEAYNQALEDPARRAALVDRMADAIGAAFGGSSY